MKKVPYEKQITDYHCGPAALRMLLRSYYGDCLDQETLGYFCNTRETGTNVKDINKFLSGMRLKLKTISQKKAKRMLKSDMPVMTAFYSSFVTCHFAVATTLEEVVGTLEHDMIYLNDPYFGKGIKYPFETFRMLTPVFYCLEAL
jgi:ABC-type bacteriocin/lantibiotic exporter with double-glycine peptidase domain